MKKFVFMLLSAFIAVSAEASDLKHLMTEPTVKSQVQLGQKFSLKQAPGKVFGKVKSTKARAPRKAIAAADLAGDYTWEYKTADSQSTQPDTLETEAGTIRISITVSETDSLIISGMFPNDIMASVESDNDGDYIKIAGGQLAGSSSYGDYVIRGLFYYEGDEQHEAGWYYDDIYGYIQEDGSIAIYPWITRVLSGGQYNGYSLSPYWVEGSTLTPAEPLQVVTLPEGVELVEYALTYTDSNGNDASGKAAVAVDGNDVYFQGFSSFIPEALIKGTKDGNTITFSANQYLGSYANMESYFYTDATFTYDEKTDTYTSTDHVYSVLGNKYFDANYYNPVLKGIVEKAVMPANPTITALKNTQYGYVVSFNVPNVDVNGDGLVSSKLSYILYTDVEGDIAPLTFTPATHTQLTDNMTEIPFGFTENYDFYDTQIYLNDLYSEDWNNLGIKSIYTGGGEINETEIQWYHIKDYSTPAKIEATFNFNTMELATSSAVTTDGDITKTQTFTESKFGRDITLDISPKTEGTTKENCFYSTKNGPQLRIYSGTLTFTAPEGYVITSLVFNSAKWNEGNTADSGEFEGTTWTGEAKTVVVTIAGNSQINSIDVILEREGVNITVGNALYATFWTDIDIDFTNSGLTAYAAQLKDTYVHLEPVTVVPSYTAVVVKAETPGTYRAFKYDNADARPELGTANDLLPAQKDVIADGTQYILARDEESETMEVGFYQAIPETTIAMGKAYIVIDSPVKAFYGFTDDDATGISEVESSKLKVESPIYNLAGQRVSKMQKGINIIGGKKVLK